MLLTASAPGLSTASFIDYSIAEQLHFRVMEGKALKRKEQLYQISPQIHLAQHPVSNTGCQRNTTAAIKHSIFQAAAPSGWATLGARTNTFVLGGGAGICPRLSSCFLIHTDLLQLGIMDVTHLQLHHILHGEHFCLVWTTTCWLHLTAISGWRTITPCLSQPRALSTPFRIPEIPMMALLSWLLSSL